MSDELLNSDGISPRVAALSTELIAFRRDLHSHPELGYAEFRTTERVAERLREGGLDPLPLPGTGLICDVGDPQGRTIALRADLDALPLQDESGLEYSSINDGVSHSCGHDVHTTILLGAGLILAEEARAGRLRGRVRLIFQPAEEIQPGGALNVIGSGGLDGVDRAYALHCDPTRDVGTIGVRGGAITSASDVLHVRLEGDGGHTSRPHVTGDLVFALAQVVTQVPAILSRRLDPRAGVAMVWGAISSGNAPNAIPRRGEVSGTLRCLDAEVWARAGSMVTDIVHDVVRPYGVRAEVTHTRGVPPTINDPDAVLLVEEAAQAELGPGSVTLAEQSLGGEDFGWMLEKVPGAMMRLGTRTPHGRTYDLHQGDLVIDETVISVGVRLLVAIAFRELGRS